MKKIFKISFIILLFYFLLFTNISLANEIIYINSVEDYINFANYANAFNGYEGMKIVLNCDLDFQNRDTPVIEGKFKGIFDGQGHKFINININNTEEYYSQAGLFEENLGIIRKVIIDSGKITGSMTTGAICANNSGIVEQCANYVDIYASHAIGGIVGWNDGQGIVRNCYNIGNITDTNPGSGGTIGFGGIVGYLYSGTILDCYNVGIIAPERNSSRGNITGTYYSGDNEFISNCFSLISNQIENNSTENLYCTVLIEFNDRFYSNLSNKIFYYDSGKIYPELNMDVDLTTLPELVEISANFDKNPLFANFDALVNHTEYTDIINFENMVPPNYKEEIYDEVEDNINYITSDTSDNNINTTANNISDNKNDNINIYKEKDTYTDKITTTPSKQPEKKQNIFENISAKPLILFAVFLLLLTLQAISSKDKYNNEDDPTNLR